ncbi:AN1-like Zinc finger [Carpediemonas membranifera]|uniref:AN1-like Zinc finger n=1 Tax=Carpediemonas membranifera TaxID=201153 RepID=A0A8J6BHE2_9EUKA|nr:AN1-like Zinc finger [Carpediemonas membranifera]|eukprot:KAG9397512.1 AN1-like Zinc finger [Carpediemonas membranifera]
MQQSSPSFNSEHRHDPFAPSFPLMKEKQQSPVTFGSPIPLQKKSGLDLFKPTPKQQNMTAKDMFSKPSAPKETISLFKNSVVPEKQKQSTSHDSSKCATCGKSTVLGFTCKCGHTYCTKHRMPEHHACTFDHAAAARSQIAKANPVVAKSQVSTMW